MNLKHLYYFWRVAKAGGVLRASESIHLSPQTISAQIHELEQALGTQLFTRAGRNLQLTDAGRLAQSYCDEIFTLTSQLETTMKARSSDAVPVIHFRVGIADVVPKAIAFQLLSPAVTIEQPVHLACREWKLERLLSDLAIHRIDLLISDSPIPSSVNVRAFNHRLGASDIGLFAAPALADALPDEFPAMLDDAPLLMPGEDSAVHGALLAWFDRQRVRPRIVAEFDDSALMKTFGEQGVGVFPAPMVIHDDVARRYGARLLGRAEGVRQEFYGISVERRITHPCVRAVQEAARARLGE